MLARLIWPLQAACRRRPLLINAAFVALTGGLVTNAWRDGLGRDQAIALAAAAVLGVIAGRGVVALAVAGAVACGGAACASVGSPDATLVMAIATAMLLPLAGAIAEARTAEALMAAITRGSGFIGFSSQLAIAGLAASGWRPCLGIAVAALVGLLWPSAASAWRPLAQPAHADQPRALGPERASPPRDVIVARIVLLALFGFAWRHDWHLSMPIAVGAGLMIVAWILTLGRVVTAAAMVAWGMIAAGLCGAPLADEALAPQRLAAIAAGQSLPLLAWWSHAHARSPSLVLASLVALAIACPLAPSALAIPALSAGATGWIVLLAAERRPRRGGPPLRGARRAAIDLSPYWRHYLRTKLAFDPLYRQVAGDAAPWGRVLDAGCGPGLIAALAAARPDTSAYCGIDLDEDKLIVARRMLARCAQPLNDRWQLLHGRLPFPQPLPRRYDTVFLLDVLHYWPPEQQGALLTQLRGALDAGGRLWLREGIAADDGDAGRVAFAERFTTSFGLNPGTGHLSFPTRSALERLLIAAGFQVAECHESGGENRLFLAVAS